MRIEARRERTPDDPAVIANRRFHGLNQWPRDLPGFRETTLEYMGTLEALCRRLVPLYALALDAPGPSPICVGCAVADASDAPCTAVDVDIEVVGYDD